MDKINADTAINNDAKLDIESEFDFEVEDVRDLDIFAPDVFACSSTTSSSSTCA